MIEQGDSPRTASDRNIKSAFIVDTSKFENIIESLESKWCLGCFLHYICPAISTLLELASWTIPAITSAAGRASGAYRHTTVSPQWQAVTSEDHHWGLMQSGGA